jgi:hypothetical protein
MGARKFRKRHLVPISETGHCLDHNYLIHKG